MKKVHICIYLLSLGSILSQAQSMVNPKVGERCPDFRLQEVHHPYRRDVTLSDFAGKWLIIDFWNKSCVLCPKSFPKLSDLQVVFQDSIEFLLVGINNKKYNTRIEAFYEKLRLQHDLRLPIAYDSVVKTAFEVRTVPHIVVIDPKGMIRAITLPDQINQQTLRLLLAGKDPYMKQKEN